MTYAVIFSAPAEADLFAIYDYIAERAGGAIALRFVESIEAYCLGFAHMPERGHQARRSAAGITHRGLPPPRNDFV
jgi:plasmid stabilization system protein ParE